MEHIGRGVGIIDEVELVVADVVVSLVVVVLHKLIETVIDLLVEVAPGLEILRAITNAAITVASKDKDRHAGEHWQQ